MSLGRHSKIKSVASSDRFIKAVKVCYADLDNVEEATISEVAIIHAYPRIGMVLSSKAEENNYKADKEVLKVLMSDSYGDDIHRIAAHITASHLIRRTPASAEILRLAETIESNAIKDLERITPGLYKRAIENQIPSFYFSGDMIEGVFSYYVSHPDNLGLIEDYTEVKGPLDQCLSKLSQKLNSQDTNILFTLSDNSIQLTVNRRSADTAKEVIGISFKGTGLLYSTSPYEEEYIREGFLSHILSVERGSASAFTEDFNTRNINTFYVKQVNSKVNIKIGGREEVFVEVNGAEPKQFVSNVIASLAGHPEIIAYSPSPSAIAFKPRKRDPRVNFISIQMDGDITTATGDERNIRSQYREGSRGISLSVGLDQQPLEDRGPFGAGVIAASGPSPPMRKALELIQQYRKHI